MKVTDKINSELKENKERLVEKSERIKRKFNLTHGKGKRKNKRKR